MLYWLRKVKGMRIKLNKQKILNEGLEWKNKNKTEKVRWRHIKRS